MSTLSFRLRFQPGIVFFQEPNVHQAAGLSVAYPLESDVEGLPRFHQGNAQSLSCGAQILPRRPFDFERVAQRPEHLAGDVALEAPDGLLLGFSVALALSDVILGPLTIRHPGHRDLVKRPVGAPVAPLVKRWRSVLPELASSGATPHREANSASLFSLSGFPPLATARAAAETVPQP